MTVSLNSIYNDDYTDPRAIEIQGNHEHPKLADSVFISGPLGFCIEVSKRAFIEAVKKEFGLIEVPSDLGELARFAL